MAGSFLSSSRDRSVWRPRSRARSVAGWALAIGAPVLATYLSVRFLDLVPSLSLLVAVALVAVVGRAAAGAFAAIFAAVLLVVYAVSDPPLASDAGAMASIVAFTALGLLLALVLPRLELAVRSIQQQSERLDFLGSLAPILEETLDRDMALRRLASYVIPSLADRCVIQLAEPGGEVRVVAAEHADRFRAVPVRDGQTTRPVSLDDPVGVGAVIRTGEAAFAPKVDESLLRRTGTPEDVTDVGLRSVIIVPLTARGRTFGAITMVVAGSDREYTDDDLRFAGELAGRAALTIDNLDAYERVRATSARNEILQRLATSLSQAVALDDVANTILVEGMRGMQARRTLIALVAAEGTTLEVLAQSGYDPGTGEAWRSFPVGAPLPMSEAVRERRMVVIEDVADRDTRYPALAGLPMDHDHSLVCLPMVAGDRVVGGMSVTYPVVRRFAPEDGAFLMAVASMAGQALRRATLFEAERTTSHLLQESLLPQRLPDLRGVSFAARYWASGAGSEVGGDFYDVVETPGGFMAVIGDVCGRGVEAAAVMGIARHAAWAAAERSASPSSVLRNVNDVLRRRVDDLRFVTMCAASLTHRDDRLEGWVTSAGHPLPVVVSGESARPVGRSGMLLGVYDDPNLYEAEVAIGADEALILYTDGVVERSGRHVPFVEDPALMGTVLGGARDAAAVAEAIEAALVSERSPTDDAAVLVVAAGTR